VRRNHETPFPTGFLRRKPTLKEWCEYWLDTNAVKRPKAKKEDRSSLELHVYPTLGHKRLDDITVFDIRLLVAQWADTVMPRTVHRRYAVLRAAINAAVDLEILDRSPCRRVRLATSAPAFAYALQPDEVALVANAVGPRYRAMVFTAAMLGLRFCECAGLRVGRLDLVSEKVSIDEGIVEAENGRLYSNPPKSQAGRRTMCLPSSLVTMLTEHLDRSAIDVEDQQALVFTSPTGGPLRYSNFRKRVWRPAIATLELPAIGFHDLRRTNATVLVQRNVDLKTAQIRLGHSDPALTLRIYAQPTDDGDRAAAALIDDHFASAVTATSLLGTA
jgi:integrase